MNEKDLVEYKLEVFKTQVLTALDRIEVAIADLDRLARR